MRIFYVLHQFFPEHQAGTEKFVYNLARMMQMFGNKVKVITYSFYEDSFYDRATGRMLSREFIYKGVPVVAFRHKRIPPHLPISMDDADVSKMIRVLIGGEPPDIVHVAHTMRVAGLVKALEKGRLPYIITATDAFLICPKCILFSTKKTLCGGPDGGAVCRDLCFELPEDTVTRRLSTARDLLFGARKVIAPSAFLASIFKKEFPELQIDVVNHGIDFASLRTNRKICAKGDPIVFCYAGSLQPHKGVHILIEAFKGLTGNALLRIYGSGPDAHYVSTLRSKAQSDPRIEFCGVFSGHELGDVLSNVDVVVIPSLCYESYSLVLHEALACNVPVIASDAGALAEKIRNGTNGFTFALGDSKDLRDALSKIVRDNGLLKKFKDNITETFIPTVEQEAYSYYAAYARALRPSPPDISLEKRGDA